MRAVRRGGGRLGAVHDSSNIIHRSIRYCGAHCKAGRPRLFLTTEYGQMRGCLGRYYNRRKALARSGCSADNLCSCGVSGAVIGCPSPESSWPCSSHIPRLMVQSFIMPASPYLRTLLSAGHISMELYTGNFD